MAAASVLAGDMDEESATRWLEERCELSPAAAHALLIEDVLDPERLFDRIALWQILDLRGEARRRLGTGFRLARFHDALLLQGGSAMPAARAAILADLALAAARGRD